MNKTFAMNNLETGQRARVSELFLHGPVRRRFFDIGFVPGNEVVCVGISPLGDPKAYLVNDAVVAVRNDDARCVKVENICNESSP